MVNTAEAVVIAGLGAVTGYGWGLDELWCGLLSGKSAAHTVVFEDFAGFLATVPEGGDEDDSITLFGRASRLQGCLRHQPKRNALPHDRATGSVAQQPS